MGKLLLGNIKGPKGDPGDSVGVYNLLGPDFGVVDPTGGAASDTAIAAWIAACASNGRPGLMPAGTYKIVSTLNWKIPGLRIITAGAQKTIINMATANIPILQVAGEGQNIGGITLRYPTQQTSAQTSSIGVEFGDDTIGSCFLSTFEDLRVFQSAKGLATNPAITGTASGVFSCYFGNVEVFGYSISAIDLNGGNGTGAGNTGCVFDNTYIHNNFSGTPVVSAAWPVILRNWSEVVFNELNIEKCIIPSQALQFAECGAVVINSLHLEGIQAGGTNLGLIGVGTQVGSVVLNALSVRFSTFTGSASNSVIQFTGGSNQTVEINGLNMPTTDGGKSTPILALVDFNSISNAVVAIGGINSLGPLATTVSINAAAGCRVVSTNGASPIVEIYGADASGTNDSSPAILAAINALPASGGCIDLGPGTFKMASTVTAIDKQVFIKGAGRWATKINFTGTGDCFRITSLATLAAPVSGGITDLTIDGTSAGAGSTGLHLGETRAFELRLAIQNFSGAGSMGMHFDNQYAWTEETHGYLWLSNNTQNLVFDVSAPTPTTVAAGSNGGTISGIATWGGTFGGNGVLAVASTALYPASGTITVAASGSTTAIVTYTGKTATTLTGCVYVSGSASGTVATGGSVGLVTSDNSFGYSSLEVEILAKDNQDGLVCLNGAIVYNSKLRVRANFRGTAAANTSAAIRITGVMPANHPHSNPSGIQNCDFTYVAECGAGSGSNVPQTINFGSITGSTQNTLIGCVGTLAFTYGALAFAATNYTSGGGAGAFSFMGLVQGDFNLNPATSGVGQAVSYFIGAPISYSRSLLNVVNGNILIDRGDYFQGILSADLTINLVGGGSALGTAQRKYLVFKQAASGGPFKVSWPAGGSGTTASPNIVWADGIQHQMTPTANAIDIVTLETYDGSIWVASAKHNVLGGMDPTGATDITATLNLALAVGGGVDLPTGTFLINGSTALALANAGTKLRGRGEGATILKIGSSFSASQAISITADRCGVSDLSIVGTSTTVTSNPVADGITFVGQQGTKIRDIFFQYVNGWCIDAQGGSSRASVDTMIRGITARNCAVGVRCLGVTGSSFLGEYFITDLQMQQMGAASGGRANLDVLRIEDISDILVQGVNIGTASGTIGAAIHVTGACATVKMTNVDVGANTAAGVTAAILIDSGANGTPTDVSIINGSAEGGVAVYRIDAGNDIVLTNFRLHQGYTSGLVVNGGDVRVMACSMAANNQSGGTGYDIDTSGMSSGNARFISCQTESAVLATTAGDVTNPVNTSTHAYYDNCYFVGTNTAPSNVFNGTPQRATNCVGYNPRGSVTATTIGTSPFTPGGYQTPLMVIFTAINGMTDFAVGGVSVGLPAIGVPYPIGVRESMTITWATTKPTWIWFGM